MSFEHINVDVQTVVQHDIANNAEQKTAAPPQSVTNLIEKLISERKQWQENAYRTSNEQLYALLQKCYGLYMAMEGNSPQAKALREGLSEYIKANSYIFSKGSHSITKIVKCVFGADRRRVSAYSIVLRAALAKRISVLEISKFISEQGGVEEIRLSKSPNAMTAKQKAELVADAVEGNNYGVVASEYLSTKLDAGKIGTNTLLVGTWQSDGSVVIRAVVESDTALNAALASYYSSTKPSKTVGTEQEAKAMAETTEQAIASALETAIAA